MENDPQPERSETQSGITSAGPRGPQDAIFTNIIWIMIANVLVGAVMVIAGATLDLPPAVGRVGLGLAVICGGIYFFFRWLQRKEARRRRTGNP